MAPPGGSGWLTASRPAAADPRSPRDRPAARVVTAALDPGARGRTHPGPPLMTVSGNRRNGAASGFATMVPTSVSHVPGRTGAPAPARAAIVVRTRLGSTGRTVRMARPPTASAATDRRPPTASAATDRRPPTASAATDRRPPTASAATDRRPPTASAATDRRPPTASAATDRRPPTASAATDRRPPTASAATDRRPPTASAATDRRPPTASAATDRRPPTASAATDRRPPTGFVHRPRANPGSQARGRIRSWSTRRSPSNGR